MIYIFIPILFAFFEKLLSDLSIKNIASFSILFIISTMAFNNIAYLGALIFLQILLSFILFATKKIPASLKIAKRILIIFVLQLFLSLYFLLPYFASQFEYVSKVSSGKVLGDIPSIFA